MSEVLIVIALGGLISGVSYWRGWRRCAGRKSVIIAGHEQYQADLHREIERLSANNRSLQEEVELYGGPIRRRFPGNIADPAALAAADAEMERLKKQQLARLEAEEDGNLPGNQRRIAPEGL